MKTVLAFDPGVTTGYAWIGVYGETAITINIGETPDWWHLDRLISNVPDVIVYEEFRALSLNVVTTSLEVIGVIKYLAYRYQIPLVCQAPSQRNFIIKRYPDVMNGYHSHHGDALMHALTYAYFKCDARKFIVNKKDPEIYIRDHNV